MARMVSIHEWLEASGMPPYGAEDCLCGTHATPDPNCELHYFMVVVERMEDCIKALLEDGSEDTTYKAKALIGLP